MRAFETSSKSKRGPTISVDLRAKRSRSLTAGAVVATPGAIQSITTLARTTGIAVALTLLSIVED